MAFSFSTDLKTLRGYAGEPLVFSLIHEVTDGVPADITGREFVFSIFDGSNRTLAQIGMEPALKTASIETIGGVKCAVWRFTGKTSESLYGKSNLKWDIKEKLDDGADVLLEGTYTVLQSSPTVQDYDSAPISRHMLRIRWINNPADLLAPKIKLEVVAANTMGSGTVTPAPSTPTPTPVPTFALSTPSAVNEGLNQSFTLTVSRDGLTGPLSGIYAVTASGSSPVTSADFGGSFPTGSWTIASGANTTTISIATFDDTIEESAETYTLTASYGGSPVATSTGTILANDTAAPTPTPVTPTPTPTPLYAATVSPQSASPEGAYSAMVERTFARSTLTATASDGTIMDVSGTRVSAKFATVPANYMLVETHPDKGTRITTVPLTALPAPSATVSGVLTTITGTGSSSAIVNPMAAMTIPAFVTGTPTGQQITINSGQFGQSMIGFGFALTDSTLQRLTVAMTAAQRSAFLNEAFGTNKFSVVRVPIGPNDFQRSVTFPTCNDVAGDFDMVNFNLTVEENSGLLTVLQEIKTINPSIRIVGCPWSPPGWMKNSGSVTGNVGDNTLKTDAQTRNAYALYFVKWIQAIEARTGVNVYSVTVQNEPYNDIGGRPSMIMSGSDSIDFVSNYMGPVFEANKISTRIVLGSASYGNSTYINAPLDSATASPYIEGGAWHAYSGSPSNLANSYVEHPGKSQHFHEMRTFLSEPIDNTSTLTSSSLGIIAGNVFLAATRAGASMIVLWNGALSPTGEPTQGSPGRRGVVRIADDGAVDRSLEYYITAHFAKYVQRGARRIDSTSPGGAGISITDTSTVAFANPDGSIVTFLWNPKTVTQSVSLVDAATDKFTTFDIPSRSIVTVTYAGLTAPARTTPVLDANPAAVTSVSYTSTTPITQAITIGAGATLLTVSIMSIRPAVSSSSQLDVDSSVSINGVALTKLDAVNSAGTTTQNRHVELWYLINPPTGAQTVSVTYPRPANSSVSTGNIVVSSQSWKGTSVVDGDVFTPRMVSSSTTSTGVRQLNAGNARAGVQLAVSSIRATVAPTTNASEQTLCSAAVTGSSMHVYGQVTMQPGGRTASRILPGTTDTGVLLATVIRGALV